MKKDDPSPTATPSPDPTLRQRAEVVALEKDLALSEHLAAQSPEQMRVMLHELRVHQIELEMQNEELRRTQAELKAARQRYFDLYDLAPVGYCTANETGLILEANLTVATLLGVPRSELVQRLLYHFIHPDDQDRYYLAAKQLRTTGQPKAYELRLVKHDGTTFWAQLQCSTDAIGSPICRVTLSDITARKQAEAALRESEARYQSLTETLPLGMEIVDEAGHILFQNAALVRALGKPTPGQKCWQVYRDDQRQCDDCPLKQPIQIGETKSSEGVGVLGGRVYEIKHTGMMYQGKLALMEVFHDITERKQAEAIQSFLAQTTSDPTGGAFFNALAAFLAKNLHMDFVCIDRLEGDGLNARTLAVWHDGTFEDNVTYALEDTPCGDVVGKQFCCFTAGVTKLFPRDQVLEDLRAESYAGVTLFDHAGKPIGLIALISRKPLANREQTEAGLKMVAGRAAGELERLEAEAQLRESEDRYRSLVEESPDLIGIYQDENLVFVNATGVRELGAKSKAELLARKGDQLIHPEDLPAAVDRIRRRLAGESGLYPVEVRYRRLDGTTLPVEVITTPITFGGKPAVQFIARDITERKQAEEQVAQSELRLRLIWEHAPVPMRLADATGRVVMVNAAYCQLCGKASAELEGQPVAAAYDPALQDQIQRDYQTRFQQGGDGWQREAEVTFGNGRRALLEVTESFFTAPDQSILLLTIFGDITARRQAEATNARLGMAVEHATETIVITDAQGAIVYANPAFEKTTGYTRAEALGQNPRMLKSGKHDAEFYRRMWAALAAGQTWSGDLMNQRKDGSLYQEEANIFPVLDASGRIVNYVAVKRDVTEQRKLEAQMLRSQRLESIGTLAGGIAHDLNNALAPITMSSELLRAEYPDTASEYLEMIQASAQRGANMVKQLLTFAKGAEGERLLVQPQHLFKELEQLIKGSFPKNLELRICCAPALRTILGDATQLHQVLLNLCVNARDAMPGGGTLTLAAENKVIDAAHARTIPEAKPGRYVEWRVTDTGTGIPPETLNRIFDPYFTTKGVEHGTGLGLSITLGIVRSHGGFIQVDSRLGQGSTFAVYLPAYGSGEGTTTLLAKSETTFRGRGETILVVDDEESVCNILRAVLAKLNFKVLTAADGGVALVLAADHQAELRAVIADLHMPRLNGLAFVQVLKARLPQVGVIVMSGRVDERELEEFRKLGVHAVLEKPCTPEKLVAALKLVFAK